MPEGADFDSSDTETIVVRKRRKGLYILPNMVTLAALFAGFYSIVMAMNGRFDMSAIGVFCAMVLDSLDGRVARMTNTQSAFGEQMDSLSDMVSFGAAPALIAYEWGLRNAAKFGAPEGVASVGGDSMGGNFSAIIAQEMQREDKPLPAMQLLIYPAIDLVEEFPSRKEFSETFSLSTDTMDWFMEQYLPEGFDKSDRMLSPGQTGHLDGLPPAVVITAGHDPLCDEGDDYARRLKDAGVPVMHKCYDHLAHAFTAFTLISPGSRKACLEIADMVRTVYSKL